MKLVIATLNQGKIEGARKAFERFFEDIEIVGVPAKSEVGDQPVNTEIYLGQKIELKIWNNIVLKMGLKAIYF